MSFCHPGVGQSVLSGGVPHSVVFTSGEDCVCLPLANEGGGGVLALLLLALLPLALPSRVGLLWWSSGVSFHQGVFMSGYSAHGGSLAALPDVGLLGKGCWCMCWVP